MNISPSQKVLSISKDLLKHYCWLIISFLLISICICPSWGYSVTDINNTKVSFKERPSHIADLWHAHNEITVMLGSGNDIMISAEDPQTSPLLFEIAPHLKEIHYGVKSNDINREFLLTQHIDLAFTPTKLQAEPLRFAHVPTLTSYYAHYPDMLRSIEMTSQALDTPYATKQAQLYKEQLTQTLDYLDHYLRDVPLQKRPTILHVAHISPLIIDGQDTLIDEWINKSGGRNVATIQGNHRPVSSEQILSWNPDVIILQADAGPLPDNSPLRLTKAGLTHHIWRNPRGIFPWDRYGSETLLQLLWSAKQCHPDLFTQLDMDKAMIQFYARFFSYHPNRTVRQKILMGAPLNTRN